MCHKNKSSWNWMGNRFLYLEKPPEPHEVVHQKPSGETRLDLAKFKKDLEKALRPVIQGKPLEQRLAEAEARQEALAKKEALQEWLDSKGASYDVLYAVDQAYNPKFSSAIAKLLEGRSIREPKTWEFVHQSLLEGKGSIGQLYARQYNEEPAKLFRVSKNSRGPESEASEIASR